MSITAELTMSVLRCVRVLVVVLTFGISLPSAADPAEEAKAAYDRGDYTIAIRIWSGLAEQGNARAQNNLGFMYEEGRGVAKDEAAAAQWYRKSAEQGFARAQNNLGFMYQEGRGVAKDETEAVQWYRRAADQGDSLAQNNLGFMYEQGRGVAKDNMEALRWYRKATEQGYAAAQTRLGQMNEQGRGIAKSDAEAAQREGKAVEQARAYAVLSLVGDQINVVTFQIATGSALDRNVQESIPVTGGIFDNAALRAADEALKGHDTRARVHLLASTAPDLFAHQDRFFDGTRIALPKEVDSAVRTGAATHLLLVTKYRADANLQARNELLGSGKLEGLGFYVDRMKWMIRSDTGERSRGFLAPFVYIRVSLVDLNTSTVIREQRVTATATLSAAGVKEAVDPWDALGPAAKVETLRRMIEKELARVVPLIVAQP